MSHRFTYTPSNAISNMAISSCVATFLPTPATLAYFFWHSNSDDNNNFFYHPRLRQCFRYWELKSFGSQFYMAYTLLIDIIFIIAIVFSVVVIVFYIERSKTEFHRSTFQDAKARKRVQDVSAANSTIFITLCGSAPWLPSILVIIMFASKGQSIFTKPHIIFEVWIWFVHSLCWMFPVLCLTKNTVILRGFLCLKSDALRVFRRIID